jgi:hypothetical protein
MSTQKLIKSVILSLAIFTLLLNFINISYSINYYTRYNESNIKMISDFNSLHQGKNTESEFNELCSKIQPANFKEVYYSLSNWSEMMIEILAIAILGYFIYLFIYLFINKEKRSEKINFKNTGAVLLLSFFISLIFYWFSIDTDFDILYCLLPFIQ